MSDTFAYFVCSLLFFASFLLVLSPRVVIIRLKMWFPEGVNDWKKTVDAWVYE